LHAHVAPHLHTVTPAITLQIIVAAGAPALTRLSLNWTLA